MATRRNLEISGTIRENDKKGSLLWVLDKTKTSMGGRLLRLWLEKPLINISEIEKRHEGVGELKADFIRREEIRDFSK
jgi:DNA mismatch repair protein MutS